MLIGDIDKLVAMKEDLRRKQAGKDWMECPEQAITVSSAAVIDSAC